LALASTFSSLITSETILENVADRESNPLDNMEKFISDWNSDWIFLLCCSIRGVRDWILFQRFQNKEREWNFWKIILNKKSKETNRENDIK